MQGVLSGLFTATSQVLRTVPALYKAPHGYLLNECTLSKDLHIRVSEIQFFLELSLQLPCSHRVVRTRVDLLDLSFILQILPSPKSCRIHPFFEDDEGHLQLLLPFLSFSLPTPCSCSNTHEEIQLLTQSSCPHLSPIITWRNEDGPSTYSPHPPASLASIPTISTPGFNHALGIGSMAQ